MGSDNADFLARWRGLVKEEVLEIYRKRGDFSAVVSVDLGGFADEVTESVREREVLRTDLLELRVLERGYAVRGRLKMLREEVLWLEGVVDSDGLDRYRRLNARVYRKFLNNLCFGVEIVCNVTGKRVVNFETLCYMEVVRRSEWERRLLCRVHPVYDGDEIDKIKYVLSDGFMRGGRAYRVVQDCWDF